MIQSRFVDIYSGPWIIYFFLLNFPFRGLLWERTFYLKGGGGSKCHFCRHFSRNIFIFFKRLIMDWIFVLTIVQLLHNSLHTAQARFRELYEAAFCTWFSHILRLQCVCSPCAVHKRCRSSMDCTVTESYYRKVLLTNVKSSLNTEYLVREVCRKCCELNKNTLNMSLAKVVLFTLLK